MKDVMIVQGLRQGDTAVFNELLRKHRPWLKKVLWRLLRSEEKAEEALQEVFLRLWQKRRELRDDSNLANWLYTVALNFGRNELKRINRNKGDLLTKEAITTEERVFNKYRHYCIKRAVEALPKNQREVFTLGHLEKVPYEQVATILNIPVGTVKSRMFHAIRRLRTLLAKHKEVLLHEM